MIAANKRLLKANLTQGVLGIQTNLIQLYTNNLTAVATQAALIAGFAFTAVTSQNSMLFTNMEIQGLAYFYYVCFTICLIAALFVLSQATVVVTYGPSMALKGNTHDSVKIAAHHMREQQINIYKVACVSITGLFLGSLLICWALYPIGIACITTVIYVGGYYYLVTEGMKIYKIFVVDENDSFADADGNGAGAKGGKDENGEKIVVNTALNEALEAIKTKARGVLWRRQPVEEGGLFIKCFGVLEKGRLDFYKSAEDFKNDANPLNKKPLKLWQLDIETDARKFNRSVTSLSNTMKSALVGNNEFSLSDLMSSEFDLKFAAAHFKFALVPKVSSELVSVEISELLAHDDKAYNQWVLSISTVIKAYDEIASSPSVEQTMRMGTSDVETVVQAANNA